ncbi:MAG TPA: iron-containing redox enzyme family protein [Egibacteraceae bacterium]|nr:iron-containing redox enzyme family protein [Egibacteraceae bacterium]
MTATHPAPTLAPRPVSPAGPPLPQPRGPLSAYLLDRLRLPVHALPAPPAAEDDPLWGEDSALALYCCYELHYRGLAGVDDAWEWEPSLLALRRALEDAFEVRLREVVGPVEAPGDVAAALEAVAHPADDGGRSLADFAADEATDSQFKELAVHRTAWQLKEADPHTWAIPRLWGKPKAALVEIQKEEYGEGVEKDIHAVLYAMTLRELGLDDRYGAYVDHLPAVTLATVSLASFFGLHRRRRGAAVGHLSMFEMTSVEPMGKYSVGLRRLGYSSWARLFYDTHVVADANHQFVAAHKLAAGLAQQEPEVAGDIVFGAKALMALEAELTEHAFACFDAGRTSLRRPL